VKPAPARPARSLPPQSRARQKAPCAIVPPRSPNARLKVKRQEGHHLLPEDVITQRRSRKPGIRGRQCAGPHQNVQDREVHGLFAPVDLRIEGSKPEEEKEPEAEDRLARQKRAPSAPPEIQHPAPAREQAESARHGDQRETRPAGEAALVEDTGSDEKARQEGGDCEAEHLREARAAIVQVGEERIGERERDDPDQGDREKPDYGGEKRIHGQLAQRSRRGSLFGHGGRGLGGLPGRRRGKAGSIRRRQRRRPDCGEKKKKTERARQRQAHAYRGIFKNFSVGPNSSAAADEQTGRVRLEHGTGHRGTSRVYGRLSPRGSPPIRGWCPVFKNS
jgi:hypothetical protein